MEAPVPEAPDPWEPDTGGEESVDVLDASAPLAALDAPGAPVSSTRTSHQESRS